MSIKHRAKYNSYLGKKINFLTVLEILGSQKSGTGVKFKCQCECGNITFPKARSVISLQTKSCGCILKQNIRNRFAPLKERLDQYIDKSTGRWLWTGYKNAGGYGRISVNRKMKLVHRLIYEMYIGPIPEGLLVCHKNDIPCDVTPENLFLGTYKDNNDDMRSKGRNVVLCGNDSPNSKLTESKVKAIRILYNAGDYTQNELSNLFNVNRATIGYIVLNKNWKHVD